VIGSGALALDPAFTQLTAGCTVAITMTEGGGAIDANAVSFDSTTGVVTINTSDAAYNGLTKDLVLTITSSLSTDPAASASSTFTISFVDECAAVTVTAPSFATTTYAAEEMWNPMSFTFSAATESLGTCGAFTYTFKSVDTAKQADTDAIFSIATLTASGTALDKTKWIGTFSFYVTATLDGYPTITGDSNQITVTIADPCTATVID